MEFLDQQRAKEFTIKHKLNVEQQDSIKNRFGRTKLTYSDTMSDNPHGFQATYRNLWEHVSLTYFINIAKTRGLTGMFVKDIGASGYRLVAMGRTFAHGCMPQLSSEDGVRRAKSILDLEAAGHNGELFDDLTNISNHFCSNLSQECNVKCPFMLLNHSAYDMSVAQIVASMVRAESECALGLMMFSPEVLTDLSGTLTDLNVIWKRLGDKIRFYVVNDAEKFYEHNYRTYIEKISARRIDTDHYSYVYSVERIRGSLLEFRIDRMDLGMPSDLLRPLGTGYDGKKYVVSVVEYNGTLKTFERKNVLTPKDLFERIYSYALTLKEGKFTRQNIFQAAQSFNTRFLKDGECKVQYEGLTTDRMTTLVTGIYLLAFRRNYETTTTVKKHTGDEIADQHTDRNLLKALDKVADESNVMSVLSNLCGSGDRGFMNGIFTVVSKFCDSLQLSVESQRALRDSIGLGLSDVVTYIPVPVVVEIETFVESLETAGEIRVVTLVPYSISPGVERNYSVVPTLGDGDCMIHALRRLGLTELEPSVWRSDMLTFPEVNLLDANDRRNLITSLTAEKGTVESWLGTEALHVFCSHFNLKLRLVTENCTYYYNSADGNSPTIELINNHCSACVPYWGSVGELRRLSDEMGLLSETWCGFPATLRDAYRHTVDPFEHLGEAAGYICRSGPKLHGILDDYPGIRGDRSFELSAAPGGWLQVVDKFGFEADYTQYSSGLDLKISIGRRLNASCGCDLLSTEDVNVMMSRDGQRAYDLVMTDFALDDSRTPEEYELALNNSLRVLAAKSGYDTWCIMKVKDIHIPLIGLWIQKVWRNVQAFSIHRSRFSHLSSTEIYLVFRFVYPVDWIAEREGEIAEGFSKLLAPILCSIVESVRLGVEELRDYSTSGRRWQRRLLSSVQGSDILQCIRLPLRGGGVLTDAYTKMLEFITGAIVTEKSLKSEPKFEPEHEQPVIIIAPNPAERGINVKAVQVITNDLKGKLHLATLAVGVGVTVAGYLLHCFRGSALSAARAGLSMGLCSSDYARVFPRTVPLLNTALPVTLSLGVTALANWMIRFGVRKIAENLACVSIVRDPLLPGIAGNLGALACDLYSLSRFAFGFFSRNFFRMYSTSWLSWIKPMPDRAWDVRVTLKERLVSLVAAKEPSPTSVSGRFCGLISASLLGMNLVDYRSRSYIYYGGTMYSTCGVVGLTTLGFYFFRNVVTGCTALVNYYRTAGRLISRTTASGCRYVPPRSIHIPNIDRIADNRAVAGFNCPEVMTTRGDPLSPVPADERVGSMNCQGAIDEYIEYLHNYRIVCEDDHKLLLDLMKQRPDAKKFGDCSRIPGMRVGCYSVRCIRGKYQCVFESGAKFDSFQSVWTDRGRVDCTKLDREELVLVSTYTKMNVDLEIETKYTKYKAIMEHSFQLVQACPGAGKTYDIVQRYLEDPKNTLVLTSSRCCRDEIVSRARSTLGKNASVNAYTIASFLLNEQIQPTRILIDEALMQHSGMLVLAADVGRVELVEIFGDEKQIPFCNRTALDLNYSTPRVTSKIVKNLSWRIPMDVAVILGNYYDTCDSTLKTKNAVGRSVSFKLIAGLADLPSFPEDTVILTYSNEEKSQLCTKYSRVYTPPEFQGSQSRNVVCVRLSTNLANALYQMESFAIVTISRHTASFTYYSCIEDPNDVLRKMVLVRVDQADMGKRSERGGAIFSRIFHYDDRLPLRKISSTTDELPQRLKSDEMVIVVRRGGVQRLIVRNRLNERIYPTVDTLSKVPELVVEARNSLPLQYVKLLFDRIREFGLNKIHVALDEAVIDREIFFGLVFARLKSTKVIEYLDTWRRSTPLYLVDLLSTYSLGDDQNLTVTDNMIEESIVDFESVDVPSCSDPKAAVQWVLNDLFPESVAVDDSTMVWQAHHNDLQVPVDEISLDVSKQMLPPRLYDDLRPVLRSQQPALRPSTLQESVLAIYKRNKRVPEFDGVINIPEMANKMFDRFCATFLGNRPAYPEIAVGRETIMKWLEKQPVGVHRYFEGVELLPQNMEEIDFQRYDFMIKRAAKARLDDNACNIYEALQTVVYQSKEINALFCPIVQEMKSRLLRDLCTPFFVYTDMSPQDFSEHVSRSAPPKSIPKDHASLEVDISKYDKSQGLLALILEIKLFRYFGFPEKLLKIWFDSHFLSRVIGRNVGVKFKMAYQRRSGDAATFFGNTIFLMSVLSTYFDLSKASLGMFSGDDSLLYFPFEFDLRDASNRFNIMMNLESKFFSYSNAAFCSKFFLAISPDRWLFIPDPIKFFVKMGRSDMKNSDHVEEFRRSAIDNLRLYRDYAACVAVDIAIAERYQKVSGCSYLFCITAVNDLLEHEHFHSCFYSYKDDVLYSGHNFPFEN